MPSIVLLSLCFSHKVWERTMNTGEDEFSMPKNEDAQHIYPASPKMRKTATIAVTVTEYSSKSLYWSYNRYSSKSLTLDKLKYL